MKFPSVMDRLLFQLAGKIVLLCRLLKIRALCRKLHRVLIFKNVLRCFSLSVWPAATSCEAAIVLSHISTQNSRCVVIYAEMQSLLK